MSATPAIESAVERMRAEGVAEPAIRTFAHDAERLAAGERGMLAEDTLTPVTDLPKLGDLPPGDDEAGRAALDRAVVIKLNGGLGTGMGMTKAKSLLPVKEGLSFLDITARQILTLRQRHGARLPLVLMNSFRTRDDSLAALARHEGLAADVPPDFLQDKVPKLVADTLAPVSWPANPGLEWAPPGHGNLYTALLSSGMLGELLDAGYEYAFVANADNLGAVLDPRILAWFAREQLPFAMEVCVRTEADRKGGHIAQRREDGRLVLRETAQTLDEDVAAFQDVDRHRYFNTNNLWVDLRGLQRVLTEREGVLGLPMIVNSKTVDPEDKGSTKVLQLESAMGAAIQVFPGAQALEVPRTRFAPVKTTDDLLSLRSDAYVLTEESHVVLAPERDGRPPVVTLDPDFFKLLRDFDERFASGAPSLVACDRLDVDGDVSFGSGVVCRGRVRIEGPQRVADGAVLEG